MRGYCKCDLCGGIYHKEDNKFDDGITVWWKDNWTGSRSLPDDDEKLIAQDGESTDIPATMDICPNCFESFCNWIRMTRNESKSPVNDKDFPMNNPE